MQGLRLCWSTFACQPCSSSRTYLGYNARADSARVKVRMVRRDECRLMPRLAGKQFQRSRSVGEAGQLHNCAVNKAATGGGRAGSRLVASHAREAAAIGGANGNAATSAGQAESDGYAAERAVSRWWTGRRWWSRMRRLVVSS